MVAALVGYDQVAKHLPESESCPGAWSQSNGRSDGCAGPSVHCGLQETLRPSPGAGGIQPRTAAVPLGQPTWLAKLQPPARNLDREMAAGGSAAIMQGVAKPVSGWLRKSAPCSALPPIWNEVPREAYRLAGIICAEPAQ